MARIRIFLFAAAFAMAACGGGGGGNTGNTVAPSMPGGVTVAADSATSVSISWQASSDNTAVTGYRIYRDSVLLKTVISTATSDSGLVTGVSYCYEISAIDAANNESNRSTSQCAMPDNVWTTRLPGVDITVESIIHDGARYVAVGDPTSTSEGKADIRTNVSTAALYSETSIQPVSAYANYRSRITGSGSRTWYPRT